MATKDVCSKFWTKKLFDENIFSVKLYGGFKSSDPIYNKKVEDAEAEYSRECGMYDEKQLECIALNDKLNGLLGMQGASALSPLAWRRNQLDVSNSLARDKKVFEDKGCVKLIEQYRQQELKDVASKFSALDKARIEEESKYVRNQRVFFGGMVLLGGIVIIRMFSKKKG